MSAPLPTVSDLNGNAELVPESLSSFAPLYLLQVSGAWRTRREALARLGDEPVELVVVPNP